MGPASAGFRAALLLGVLSLGSSATAGGQEDLASHVLEAASAFVVAATGEDVPAVSVRRAHLLELQVAVFGSQAPHRPDRAQVAAAFDPVRGEIVIAEDIDLTTPLGLSFLVHELVHSQQHAAGRLGQARCPGMLEAEAYALQARFLRSRQKPREAMLFEILGLLQATCAQVR